MGRGKILLEGFLVGMAGAVAVAVWFLAIDVAAGMPLRTPALLGAALLHGLRDPSELVITPALVATCTAVHCVLLLLFGWAAASLFALAVLFGVFMLFLCFEVAALALAMMVPSWLLNTLSPTAIVGANFVAATVMLTLLFRNHRRVPAEILTSAE